MQVVVIYGNSLVVSSIGASLQNCESLQMLSLDPALPDAKQRLSDLRPDSVIFDLAAAQPDFAVSLWKVQPHLLLIGVDLEKGQALVFSSQTTQVRTMDDLLQVMTGQASEDPRPPDQRGQTSFSK